MIVTKTGWILFYSVDISFYLGEITYEEYVVYWDKHDRL